MRALGKVLDRLAPAMGKVTDKIGTDAFFVLRAGTAVSDGRGGTKKSYQPTTSAELSCFHSVIQAHGADLERIVAERKVALVFRRLVCAASVNATTKDRIKLVARGAVPELPDLEIVRSVLLSGVLREIVVVEEQKAAS